MKATLENSTVKEDVIRSKAYFKTGQSKKVPYRISALKRLRAAIQANEDAICEALYKDFKKPKFESLATETQFVLAELDYLLKNVAWWSEPKKVSGSWSTFPSRDWIHYEPYGNVLIIAPWNYPFQLCISPLIGAIAAGNTVVLKPSEFTPHTGTLLEKMVDEVFEPGHVTVVQGGVATSQELLAYKWDYIFFTGSTRVGKIIYQSAAKQLTPVTLELGGKNPCIIDATANIPISAKRIVWGKFMNAGQTCIAPDYLLVHHSVKEKLIVAIIKCIEKSYGKEIATSPDYARIATTHQFNRLVAMIEGQEILFGGNHKAADQFVEPTLLNAPSLDSMVMQDEIFGPVLPVIGYETEEELEEIISRYEKPLAFYVFSNDKKFQKRTMRHYAFGGGAINDTVIQITNKNLPFGGVGNSGIGGYHGKHSYELFSHKKGIIKKSNWMELPVRYAPYQTFTKLAKWFKHFI
ncbi:MAG: aldehyde dehydrogenase [Bacteroidota bacterium]